MALRYERMDVHLRAPPKVNFMVVGLGVFVCIELGGIKRLGDQYQARLG
jgi:hypothetical protein